MEYFKTKNEYTLYLSLLLPWGQIKSFNEFTTRCHSHTTNNSNSRLSLTLESQINILKRHGFKIYRKQLIAALAALDPVSCEREITSQVLLQSSGGYEFCIYTNVNNAEYSMNSAMKLRPIRYTKACFKHRIIFHRVEFNANHKTHFFNLFAFDATETWRLKWAEQASKKVNLASKP